MDEQKGTAIVARGSSAVALQDLETGFAVAVRQRELLSDYIRSRLHPGKHFYKVADGQKPSLTKEGAELVNLPHGLKPQYEIVSGPDQPPADDSPYQVTVRCELRRGEHFEGQGLGSASSWQTKKDGSRKPRQIDPGLCHNATLKMAAKSSYIAATLNATAASEFFTQDLEDIAETPTEEPTKSTEHYCKLHGVNFFRRGNMKGYAHPIGDTKKWCNEPSAKGGDAPEASEPPESPAETAPGSTPADPVYHPEAYKAPQPQKRGSTGRETPPGDADLRAAVKAELLKRWPNDHERRNEAAFCHGFGKVATVEEIPPEFLLEALEMAPGPKGRAS